MSEKNGGLDGFKFYPNWRHTHETYNRIDVLEKESRRVAESLATLNDILLTEGRVLSIIVDALEKLEKGEKK